MPSCIKTYHLPKNGADVFNEDGERKIADMEGDQKSMTTPCFMMLLGSFNNFLMVYRDVRLVWAART